MSCCVNVKVKISSVIENLLPSGLCDGECERTGNEAAGTLDKRGGIYRISYSETGEGGEVFSEITVNSDSVRVVRRGAIVSDILFKENFSHKSLYTVPPYAFDMEVSTSKIRRGEGRLDIFYKMTLGGQDKRVKMTLEWK